MDFINYILLASLACGVTTCICRPWAKYLISGRAIAVQDLLGSFGIGIIPIIGWMYAGGYTCAVLGWYASEWWDMLLAKMYAKYPSIRKFLNFELFK